MCKARKRDVKKLNRVLLQTHEYNQRTNNADVLLSLIKKEIDLFEGVIPVVEYNTLTYYIPVLHPIALPSDCELIKIESTNLHILTDYLYNMTHNTYDTDITMFDICIMQDTSYYLSQIKSGILHVYCLRHKEHVYGFYFYKNTYTEYEDIEGNVLMFSTSIKNISDNHVYYSGFINSMCKIMKEKQNKYKMLMIENIGHSNHIVSLWELYNKPIFDNKTAYYLYNFIYPCFSSITRKNINYYVNIKMCIDSRMDMYLFRCNMTRDIENNVDEVETPEFTMEDVNEIDMNYKIHMSELILFEREEEMSLQEMHTSFVLNELFIEHLDYMQQFTRDGY